MRKDSGSSNTSDGSFTYSPSPYGYNPQVQQIYGQQQPIYQQNQYQQSTNIGIGVNQINSQNVGAQYGYNTYGYSADPYGQSYKY
jgi:hypothetical protein